MKIVCLTVSEREHGYHGAYGAQEHRSAPQTHSSNGHGAQEHRSAPQTHGTFFGLEKGATFFGLEWVLRSRRPVFSGWRSVDQG